MGVLSGRTGDDGNGSRHGGPPIGVSVHHPLCRLASRQVPVPAVRIIRIPVIANTV